MTLQKNSVRHTTRLLGKCLRGNMNLISGKVFTVLVYLQPETLLKSKTALILGQRKIQAGVLQTLHYPLALVYEDHLYSEAILSYGNSPYNVRIGSVHIVHIPFFYWYLLTFLAQILKKASSTSPACFRSVEGSVRVLFVIQLFSEGRPLDTWKSSLTMRHHTALG